MTITLCGDIGGTNANLCIAEVESTISLKPAAKLRTRDYNNFVEIIKKFLASVEEKPTAACFAVAGPVKNNRVEMTNSPIVVDAKEIQDQLAFKKTIIINDFQAIGYATNILEKGEIKTLNKGSPETCSTRAVLGAGTGLGKNILIYDVQTNAFLPHPSEGGHTDFPVQNESEQRLINFIKAKRELPHSVTYEDLLSGRGLEDIYQFLQQTKFPKEKPTLHAKEISSGRKSHPCSEETFRLFVRFYARCAKNFVLDTYALGGIFIAGGIAAHNHDMFDEAFLEEFCTHSNRKFHEILKNIPIQVIINYGVSLKGAAFALKLRL